MKFRRLFALFFVMLLLSAMNGCKFFEKDQDSQSSSQPAEELDPNYPVSIGDIRITARPDTIVSLSPALTEMICELGAEDRLAGISDFCDYPDSIRDLLTCGTSQLINRDEIKAIAPQVLFSSATLSQEDTVWLQQQDIEVAVIPAPGSIDEMETAYVTLATILDGLEDGKANGESYFGRLRERYEMLAQAGGSIAEPLSGVYLRMPPLMMATGDTFESRLLEMIGIKNDAGEYTVWEYPQDKAVDLYPDVIFYDASIDPEYFKGTQIYNTTDAYKNNRMYAFDATAFERRTARMFDELEKMFREAYPDVSLSGGSASETDISADDSGESSLPPIEEPE